MIKYMIVLMFAILPLWSMNPYNLQELSEALPRYEKYQTIDDLPVFCSNLLDRLSLQPIDWLNRQSLPIDCYNDGSIMELMMHHVGKFLGKKDWQDVYVLPESNNQYALRRDPAVLIDKKIIQDFLGASQLAVEHIKTGWGKCRNQKNFWSEYHGIECDSYNLYIKENVDALELNQLLNRFGSQIGINTSDKMLCRQGRIGNWNGPLSSTSVFIWIHKAKLSEVLGALKLSIETNN